MIIIISFVSNQQLQHFNLQLKNNHSDIWICSHHLRSSSFKWKSYYIWVFLLSVCSSSSSSSHIDIIMFSHPHYAAFSFTSSSVSSTICHCWVVLLAFAVLVLLLVVVLANPLEILLACCSCRWWVWSAKAHRAHAVSLPLFCIRFLLPLFRSLIFYKHLSTVVYLLRVWTPTRILCSTYIYIYCVFVLFKVNYIFLYRFSFAFHSL